MNGAQGKRKSQSARNASRRIGTEIERSDYYVYVWLDPRKPGKYKYGDHKFKYEPFYVGKGSGNRAVSSKHKHNPHLKRKLNKIIPMILYSITMVTEQEAFKEEQRLISLIGRADLRVGPLCNMTDGGEGCSGKIITKEHRQKLSIALKGRPSPRKNFHHSDEAKRKLSISHKGVKKSEETRKKISEFAKKRDLSYFIGIRKGAKLTDEQKEAMSNRMKGKSVRKKGTFHHTEETKKKISLIGIGRVVSDETKRKISETFKRKARRKELGLTADVFESSVKNEIAEYYEPEGWK